MNAGISKILQLGFLVVALMLANSAFASEAKKSDKDAPPAIQYVELDPLLLPIIDDTGITQQVSLIVKLEIDDPTKLDSVKEKTPKIVDAFVSDLYGSLSQSSATMENGVLRLDRIKSRLKKTADKVMGDNTPINDVLLQVVQQHRV